MSDRRPQRAEGDASADRGRAGAGSTGAVQAGGAGKPQGGDRAAAGPRGAGAGAPQQPEGGAGRAGA
ncbi:DEAD/DEAH box helicase, partial [Streptomyces tricolor]